jgi:demethylmenaquinone methyltransferase / 2-methoxy-6-polyprenyl-1,4-benzoquinol methylase
LKKTENNSDAHALYGMFTDIPPRYDLINRLITWGMDKSWRLKTAEACLAFRPRQVLDLCCGTGDLSIVIASLANYQVEIRGIDYSQPMLDIAAAKTSALVNKTLIFFRGEAAKMPFPDEFFDCIGISFAFRNLTYKNPLAGRHLAEMVRVLKKGGRCVIAESSQPVNGFIRACYHFYMRQYAGRIGGWLSGNKAAYRYLGESAAGFYGPAELSQLLIKSGFQKVDCQPLFFGAAGIYTASK